MKTMLNLHHHHNLYYRLMDAGGSPSASGCFTTRVTTFSKERKIQSPGRIFDLWVWAHDRLYKKLHKLSRRSNTDLPTYSALGTDLTVRRRAHAKCIPAIR